MSQPAPAAALAPRTLTHFEQLEAEAIHIMREVVAEAENPVMLYARHLAGQSHFPELNGPKKAGRAGLTT